MKVDISATRKQKIAGCSSRSPLWKEKKLHYSSNCWDCKEGSQS